MSIGFATVAVGVLYGIPVDMVVNMVSERIYEKVFRRDAVSLIEKCLADAVQIKLELLNRFVSPIDSSTSAYLDKKKLRQYLGDNSLIEPLASEAASSNPWRAYLRPFQEIIVIPGCKVCNSEHLNLIEDLLHVASQLFNRRVPMEHPAFEQLMLKYQELGRSNHKELIKEIRSVPYKAAQQIKETLDSKNQKEEKRPETEWNNPFSVVATDHLDVRNPVDVAQLRSLFISRYTDLSTVRKRFNTILEGQRGTGKTMILKYLAFEIQILEWVENRKKENFLKDTGNFIGIYSKMAQGVFDKSDFEAIDNVSRRQSIFEHRLTLELMFDTLETMKSVFSHFSPDIKYMNRIADYLQSYLKIDEDLKCNSYEELLTKAQDHIRRVLIKEIDTHLSSVSPGSPGGPTVCNPWLKLFGDLIPLLRLLRECCGSTLPFFFLLDDFDVLDSWQQACVFKTAASREFSVVCFKFGLMVLGRKVSLTSSERTFRQGDDYDHIDLDWTEGGLHGNYSQAALDIASARLREARWPTDLSSLLPSWQRGEEILTEVRAEMEKEWEAAEKKPTISKSDYFSKYGNARFFQHLRSKKIRMRYAGIEYVTGVSSGIFRQFLETCKLIFDRAHDEGWLSAQGGVRSEIQDGAIREYSEEMVSQLTHTAGDAETLLSGNTEVTSMHMITLIDSLSDLFYSRLHTQGSGEPEIMCIAVRDDLNKNPKASTYLRTAVRESILHRLRYPPKTAGGPDLPTFMLNRRLAPRRDLSVTRMQGRIEVVAQDIVLAVSNRARFLQAIAKRSRLPPDQQQL